MRTLACLALPCFVVLSPHDDVMHARTLCRLCTAPRGPLASKWPPSQRRHTLSNHSVCITHGHLVVVWTALVLIDGHVWMLVPNAPRAPHPVQSPSPPLSSAVSLCSTFCLYMYTPPPTVSQDKTVELRKSCDYCVRLKRACDGKNPCSLCSRRNKPCTRSARKKSGPAKGTKYAPRRKRSVIAEWADHASLGREAGLPHDFAGGGGGGSGGGAGAGGQLHHNLTGEAAAAAAARAAADAAYGGPPSSLRPPPARRYGGEASWSSDPLASTLSRHPQGRGPTDLGRPPPSMPSHSSGLPFPMGWYGAAPGHEGAEAGGGAGAGAGPGDYRQLGHRLEPTMGYAPTSAEALSRRQEHHGQDPRSGAWPVSSLEAEGAGGRPAAEMDPQRRTWEPPPGSWAGHSEPLVRSPQGAVGLSHGQRVRLVSSCTLCVVVFCELEPWSCACLPS